MKQAVSSLIVSLLLSLCVPFAFAAPPVLAPGTSESPPTVSTGVNINSADAQSIALTLSGVGIKKAEAIVAWRQSNGRFESVEPLLEVKGIGPAILAKNRDKLQLK
ncbi:MAG: helix-hairpin-helix domain-containing protein [Exilibacterium sp.]